MQQLRILINSRWVMGEISTEEKLQAEILFAFLEGEK